MTLTPRTVEADGSRLVAYDHGAHVATVSLACTEAPVVWLSEQAVLDGTAAIRGGVPLCFPWFGGGPAGELSPSHGVARTADWTPDEPVDGESLAWLLTREDVAGLPGAEQVTQPFTARYAVRLGDALDLELTVCNDGDRDWPVEVALHTYLGVGDVRQVVVTGLDAAAYLDKVSGARAVQDGDLTPTGPTDRVYDRAGTVVVHDPALGRELVVDPRGTTQTVVWNPWAEGAATMADLADDAWTGFLCVEAAATGDLGLTVPAGGSISVGCRVALRLLPLGATMTVEREEN